MLREELAKSYEPAEVEQRWSAYWEENNMFHADENGVHEAFSIVIPPPNVTGVLHMGHALNNTLQDILCRYHRLLGHDVLWIVGTDHAGIATQNVVERALAQTGVTREDLGRSDFVAKVWEWRREKGGAIINQLKRLGASCDWQRERFTMDEGLSKAVRKVFVSLYQEGLIYRANYLINWCPRCKTALADLEVEHEDLEGALYYIKYPFADNSGAITVATTRPETMLGDTAVAVNPNDPRFADLPQTHVRLPLADREIPIIFDTYVDMEFGTGGLKVTPAHDPNDFELGQKHRLETLKVIDDTGHMTAAAGAKFAGMERFKARLAVVEALQAEGLLEKIAPLTHSVGHCYRCKTVIEPNLSLQWFVKTKPLAAAAIKAVENGATRIIPKTWENTYFDWMYNIRDWCISRQVWWGHQIPVWTCADCNAEIVEMEDPATCPQCGGANLTQEADVLDTWFSSALWPFSTMGWPDETPLLKKFYPTSVLITAFDIIFFWVARMIMMGLHCMHEAPFKDVYIHALVRDEEGQKMSKSKGNVIDPLTIMDAYGTDAFRFTLAAFAAQGRDIKMSEQRVTGYRNFVNKLWNAARFVLMQIDEKTAAATAPDLTHAALADKWILSRLAKTTKNTATALEEYRFNDAAGGLYAFVWHEFCDWYLEAVKPVLYGSDEQAKAATKAVLRLVLHDILILLHPFMPFVTEEIWHKLPGTKGSITYASWPQNVAGQIDDKSESTMELVIDVITRARNIRGEMNLSPGKIMDVVVYAPKAGDLKTLEAQRDLICNLGRIAGMELTGSDVKPANAAAAIAPKVTVYALLDDLIDMAQEATRLTKELEKTGKELEVLNKKLNNPAFMEKARPEAIEKVKQSYTELASAQNQLQESLAQLKK